MSWRKGSTASANSSASDTSQTSRPDAALPAPYPFALALRVRVVQIVCGISGLVVGAVACLEQRGRLTLTLGLGVPAGAVTVLAAAASIYYSRGWGGYSGGSPTKSWGAPWRALGPTPRSAVPLAALWIAACALHVALLVLACDALFATTDTGLPSPSTTAQGVACAQLSTASMCAGAGFARLCLTMSSSTTARGVACAQLALSTTTLSSAAVVARLDLRHDAS